MSAITYPAANRSQMRPAPAPVGILRRFATWRPRRWDDRSYIERNASATEVTLRSVPGVPYLYR